MPPTIFWLTVVKQGWAFFAVGAMLRLFWFYGKGIFFTAKNGRAVSCDFSVITSSSNGRLDYEMQGLQNDMALSTIAA